MLLILLLALWVVLRNVLHPPPGSCGVLLHPHFTEDSFVFWLWSGGANLARYVPGRDEKICHHHEELDMKVSIELDRKDILSLIAVFLLMLPNSGALRGSEAGESLLYLIHRNNVHADAMLGPTGKGANNGA